MNAQDRVVGAILAALLGTPPVAAGNVFEEELRKAPETMEEFIVVRFGDSFPERGTIKGAPVDWTTTVIVECYARRDERTTAGRASRRLHQEAFDRLMVDPTLGGVLMDLQEPRITSGQDQGTTELGCCIGQYAATHRTQSRSLEA